VGAKYSGKLENSLHFEKINHFIKTFLVNSKRSQLLFTTHNINMLMEDFIRRDAEWFCEKNAAGATSTHPRATSRQSGGVI
jgi:AAA15 family ATPase/GTPase